MVGLMAVLSRCSIREVSRQRQRCGIGGGDRVSPGGKTLRQGDQRFDQNGDQELALEPGSSPLGVDLLEVAKGEQRFEPLEGELDLPATSVQFEDGGCRDVCVKGGED